VLWRRPAKRGRTTPLVVLLHGRGADEHDLLDLVDYLPRAFAYASVRAFVALPEGGYTWFESRGPARPIPASVRSSVDAFRAWLDRPSVAPPGTPCFLFGFSAGMMMAGALVLADPARFAGAVLLSGALAFDSAVSAAPGRLDGVPVFHAHGTADDVIPRELALRSAAYLENESGASLTSRRYPIGHSISGAEIADIATWLAENETGG
jgi:phospholipase/carboxylesterase